MSNQLVEPLGAVLDRAPASWAPLIETWRASSAGQSAERTIAERLEAGAVIYPAAVLRALELTPRQNVRVVILGQDPYHGPGQAEGLSFSIPRDRGRLQPSVLNIFRELARDLGVPTPTHGHLGAWARQGVLLLNAFLTVEQSKPKSHRKIGWGALTDALIEAVADDARPKVYMLWGDDAQAKAALAQGQGQHLVLKARHPSPFSAHRQPSAFLGCGHFGEANRFLQAQGQAPIDWSIDRPH
jgi:uracil-DNA glycosylase